MFVGVNFGSCYNCFVDLVHACHSCVGNNSHRTLHLCNFNCPNGSLFVFALILSLIVLMFLSTSGTCSSRAVVLTVMPIISIGCLIHFPCLSARMCHTLNPLRWYVWVTCCNDFIMVALLSSLIISIVLKWIALDVMTMNERSFIDVHCIYCKCHVLMFFEHSFR